MFHACAHPDLVPDSDLYIQSPGKARITNMTAPAYLFVDRSELYTSKDPSTSSSQADDQGRGGGLAPVFRSNSPLPWAGLALAVPWPR